MLNRREEKKLLVLKHRWNCAEIWIYTDVLSGFVNYLESDLITLCVYVNIRGSDNSSNGLFICWNAGQVGIVGFDLKDSQYIKDCTSLLFTSVL